MKHCTAIFILLIMLPLGIFAQSDSSAIDNLMQNSASSKDFDQFSRKLDQQLNQDPGVEMDSAQTARYRQQQFDLRMDQLKYQQRMVAIYSRKLEYNSQALNHRISTLWYQFVSGLAIFLLVVSVVLAGLIFSYMQFKVSLDAMRKKNDADPLHASAAGDAPPTTLKIGAGSIEVTSSVVGIIILSISIVFFFLYLRYVYPIQEIGKADTKTEQTATP